MNDTPDYLSQATMLAEVTWYSTPDKLLPVLVATAVLIGILFKKVLPMLDAAWLATLTRCILPLTDKLLESLRKDRPDAFRALLLLSLEPEMKQLVTVSADVRELTRAVASLAKSFDERGKIINQIPDLRSAMERNNQIMAGMGHAVERLTEVMDLIRDDHNVMKGFLKSQDPNRWDGVEKRHRDMGPPRGMGERREGAD